MTSKILLILSIFVLIPTLAACSRTDWRHAPRHSAGIAPLPQDEPQAVVHVYAARAINWRGWFAVHTWIATKEKNADHYTTYQVMGWQLYRTGSSVMIGEDIPDRYWYGASPSLIDDLRGADAEAAIPKIKAAAASYTYADTYRVWPGPNSNTFISHIIRNVPELGVELPPHAIGRDWIGRGDLFGPSESGTGYQVSLFGAMGVTVGLAEGFEANILGLTFGVDFARPAIKLPFIGRVGMKDAAF